MKISIITICFNSADTIEDTIKSVLSQNYPNIEYIIVDGESTDNTKVIIEKYRDKINTFISEKDNGIYSAMNKGVKLATGHIVGILNSDDLYSDPNVITNVVNKFLNPSVEGIYGDLVYVSRTNTDKVSRVWKAGEYKEGMFLKGWMPPHPSFFVKRNIYEKFGMFNTQLTSAADYELMLRFIHKEKTKIAYLPEVLVKMRDGGKSNISIFNRIKANREDLLAWKINGLKPGPFTLILKPFSKIGQFLKR
ncbi:MAG: glycosyltransferase [Bacteroidetes bacterium]|nr:glycosyltransferase [Bacteroidota bacterium]HET6243370.1 glycosyltransferase family 2 protein [Bacteroidia bacterium]